MILNFLLTRIVHGWIKDKLHKCISLGHSLPGWEINVHEEDIVQQLMESANHRMSFDDIWTIACGGVSLARYQASLVPCFFGLDLVRFECTSTLERNLRII
jgi:hypothetical protein